MNLNRVSFVEEKLFKSPEMPPRSPAAWVLPGEFNAMKNCARCNGRLAMLSGDIIVPFIDFPLEFDRTQGPFFGGKVGKVT